MFKEEIIGNEIENNLGGHGYQFYLKPVVRHFIEVLTITKLNEFTFSLEQVPIIFMSETHNAKSNLG